VVNMWWQDEIWKWFGAICTGHKSNSGSSYEILS
jgi:hypothetical protein